MRRPAPMRVRRVDDFEMFAVRMGSRPSVLRVTSIGRGHVLGRLMGDTVCGPIFHVNPGTLAQYAIITNQADGRIRLFFPDICGICSRPPPGKRLEHSVPGAAGRGEDSLPSLPRSGVYHHRRRTTALQVIYSRKHPPPHGHPSLRHESEQVISRRHAV